MHQQGLSEFDFEDDSWTEFEWLEYALNNDGRTFDPRCTVDDLDLLEQTIQHKLPAQYHAFLSGRGNLKEPVTVWQQGKLKTGLDFRYHAVLARSSQRGWKLPEGLTLVAVDTEYPFEDIYLDERDGFSRLIGVITGDDLKALEQGLRNARYLALSLRELLIAGTFAQQQAAKFSYHAYARAISPIPDFGEHARIMFRQRSVPVHGHRGYTTAIGDRDVGVLIHRNEREPVFFEMWAASDYYIKLYSRMAITTLKLRPFTYEKR